jgi:hypothetical protein
MWFLYGKGKVVLRATKGDIYEGGIRLGQRE